MARNAAAKERKERFTRQQRALETAFLLLLVERGAAFEDAARWAFCAMRGANADGTRTWHKVRTVLERCGFDYSTDRMSSRGVGA